LVEIRSMRQLLAIRSHGSLAKAARALGVSQPSLSASMARLEDRLKVKLFERSASGSELTPIGEVIAERASKVVRETEQIIRDAGLVAGGAAGTLRLGFGAALPERFLSRLVSRLVETYPALDLATVVLDRDQLIPLLRAGDLEMAICSYGDDLVDENLLATEVLTARAVAVAHPDHELARASHVSMERFASFPSVGASQKFLSNTAALGYSATPGRVARYKSNHYAPWMDVVLSGLATLIAPDFVVQPHIDAGRLRRINLDFQFKLSFVAVATRAATYSPIVRRAMQYAADLGAELQRERAPG
jgi:DNA-binding transcriptional LysR family regulator